MARQIASLLNSKKDSSKLQELLDEYLSESDSDRDDEELIELYSSESSEDEFDLRDEVTKTMERVRSLPEVVLSDKDEEMQKIVQFR